MRDIDPDILAELADKELRPFLLLDMEIDSSHHRYTDCDVPIIFGGNTYSARDFSFDRIKYSSQNILDSVEIDIDNLDSVMTSIFVGGTPQGSAVKVDLVLLDASYDIIASDSVGVFEGEIDAWNLDEEKCVVTVTSLFAQWSQRTLSKTWCDRTYARCQALGNTDNFGGFRWVPSMIDKEIWWGRVRGGK